MRGTHGASSVTGPLTVGAGGGGVVVTDVASLDASFTRNTSCRAPEPDSPPGSTPSVFSQFEVNNTQRPSGDTFGRGMYQKDARVASRSLWISLRWCAKRHT